MTNKMQWQYYFQGCRQKFWAPKLCQFGNGRARKMVLKGWKGQKDLRARGLTLGGPDYLCNILARNRLINWNLCLRTK